ncbi:hypothetical protein CL689_00045 [Candidatus Saccharibacteria bacterium]|nr:hypothetical protein [Candidatus Saccharibacteria bacterium]MBQ68444.1 hypothetical protein [Candidatus Saccharibacteria bacterium]|tara:strand:+ start:666 stop:1535 length:870 start_codon:yes stop_codon:yes gene_type:complete
MIKKDTTHTTSTASEKKPVDLLPTQPSRPAPVKVNPLVLTIIAVFALMATIGLTSGITAWLVRADLQNTQQIAISDQPVSQGVAVVEKVADSVVSITTETAQYDWFGRQAISSGAGSGVIISEDGYILTNNHVIDGADSVYVTTTDDKEYEANVVATEPDADLALLKVANVTSLRAAELGDANDLQVGQDVYAIGNALGQYPNSVTKGIISGLGRPITAVSSGLRGNLQEFEDLIQTDAAINSGNSGGPLVNADGKVIGINTAVAGQAQNIGFSVPINRAQDLIQRAES